MSEKHDRSYARTAQDIERKYQFGKTFAEMLGLINDSRDKVDSVESSLRDEIKEQSTTLKRDTEKIVMEAEERLGESISQVGVKVDAHAVNIEVIEEKMAEGATVASTGYKFDKDGLHIAKSGEAMSNLLDNTGMYVRQSGNDILTANKDGVYATNLHADHYLIIGEYGGRSRIEDYDINRTGVFWIGS